MKNDGKKVRRMFEIAVFICMAAIVHLYGIEKIPDGIHVDEMGMGYDAWCLAHFGVDRYLKSYPVYLTNFGGGQSALYAYLCMPFVEVFGLSALPLRIPGILLFLAASCFGIKVFLLSEESERMGKARLCAFLLTILPVFILLFRIGMDCNLMLAMSMVFLYFLIRAVKSGSTRDYAYAGIAGGILLYTYVLSYVVMPFFLILFLAYMIYIRKIRFRQIVALGIPMMVLAMPLIFVQVINMFDLQEFKIGVFTVTKLFHYRIGEIDMDNFSLQSFLQSLKSIFMFDRFRYNTIPRFGTIYYISIPFAVIGAGKCIAVFCASVKKKRFCMEAVYLMWLLVVVLLGCLIQSNTNKLNAAFAAVLFVLVEGIYQVAGWFEHVRIGRQAMATIVCIYAVTFLVFLGYYFGGQYMRDYDKLELFQYPLDEAIEYVDQNELCRDKPTYIDQIGQTYIYYLGATETSPYEYDMESSLDGAGVHGRYHMQFPEQYPDWDANYIIANDYEEHCQYFEELGFQKFILQHYNIYSFQFDSYEEIVQEMWPMALGWDQGVNGADQILLKEDLQTNDMNRVVLVGWSYNREKMCPWTSVYMRVGESSYYAASVERPDVAEAFHRKELLNSGIFFEIPSEAFDQEQEIVLYCVDAQNKMYQRKHMELTD